MAFGFNPFTGNFDLTGGGDAAPFAGQVDAYADLPLDSTAALNSRWLVKNNSGTWPFSTYKQAGIYIRVSTAEASRDTDYQFVGTLPSVMNDNEFLIYDDTDATKNLKFNVGANVPTASTVTLTAPAASGTLARTEDFASPPAIGNTTPAAGTFTTLAATGTNHTFGVSDPASATQLILYSDGAPNRVHKISARSNQGLVFSSFSTATTGPCMQNGGNLRLAALAKIRWSSNNNDPAVGADSIEIARDADDAVAMRRGTNPQTFNIYNTYTSSTNHERGFLRWSGGNVFQIGTEKGSGGGTARALEFQTDGVTRMTLGSAGEIGFFGTAAAAQPAAIADATDAATTQARLNDLLAAMRTLGLIDT
jgi:hypothetical protein